MIRRFENTRLCCWVEYRDDNNFFEKRDTWEDEWKPTVFSSWGEIEKAMKDSRYNEITSLIATAAALTFSHYKLLKKDRPDSFIVEGHSVSCQHEYKEYRGFSEAYMYCVKCDKKKY